MSCQGAVSPKGARKLHDADVVYLYDGSFEGFLSCVFESFARKELPFGVWPQDEPQPSLFAERYVDTDPARAARVYASIPQRLGARAKELVSYGFLSGETDKERALLRFLQFAYAAGPKASWMHGHEAVAPVWALEKGVRGEAHQFAQFLRFSQSGGALGAVIDPRHYVLPLLRGHFCGRYPEETFVIYDRTHRAALVYQDHQAGYLQLEEDFRLPPASEDEQAYQALWKAFYNTIAIRQRQNLKLRRSHCPKRYWGNMLELQGEA